MEALLARLVAQVVHLDQLELEVLVAPLSLVEAAELLSHQLHQVQEEQVHLLTEVAEEFLSMVALVALPCQEEQEELLVPVVEEVGLHEPPVREESPYQELVEALYHSEQEGSAAESIRYFTFLHQTHLALVIEILSLILVVHLFVYLPLHVTLVVCQ